MRKARPWTTDSTVEEVRLRARHSGGTLIPVPGGQKQADLYALKACLVCIAALQAGWGYLLREPLSPKPPLLPKRERESNQI